MEPKETVTELSERKRQLLERFFRRNRFSKETKKAYGDALLNYTRAIKAPLEETCNQALIQWYGGLDRDGYEPGTIFLYATKLRRLYAFALEESGLSEEDAKAKAKRLFKAVPLSQLKRDSDRRNDMRDKLITADEFERLLAATDHPRVRTFLTAEIDSGCRPSELLGLRLRDLEFKRKYAEIRIKGKTGERTIALVRSIPYLRAWLQVHPDKHNPDAPVFATSRKGKVQAVQEKSVGLTLRNLRKRAGIKRRIYPYMLRHTRLTELADRGFGEYQMKNFAGWTPDSRMASRYIHLSGRASVDPILELEGIAKRESDGRESILKTKTCPRCGAENEVDAQYCNRCSLILDEKLLFAKAGKEGRERRPDRRRDGRSDAPSEGARGCQGSPEGTLESRRAERSGSVRKHNYSCVLRMKTLKDDLEKYVTR